MFDRNRATSIIGACFHFAVAITSYAQDELYHNVRTENDDLRDGGEPGTVAADPPPLSLHPLLGT